MSGRLAWRGGTPSDLSITSVRVVDPRSGLDGTFDVTVATGVITELRPSGESTQGSDVIDGTGMILMPAFTDPHVHFRTPGQEHKETISTGTASAAAGGYCQVIAMPNTSPVIDSPEILSGILARAAAEAVIPMGQMGAVTKGLGGVELTEMATMREIGAVGFTDDGMPIVDAGVFRRAVRYQQLSEATIALHEEDPALSLRASLNEGATSARLGLAGGSGLSESTMITRDCAIAEAEGARIHVQHLSDARSVQAVREAKARGVLVTAEASPHHLLLTEEACATLDTRTKMNPPLRFEHDRQALIDGLNDGTIDCVATDHAPHSDGEKEQPFEDAPFGVTGLETSFVSIYDELVVKGIVPLSVLVERMTSGCEPFGLQIPTIAEGKRANLVLFNTDSPWTCGEGGWASRSSNNAFIGRRFSGRVVLTLADGVEVYRHIGLGGS
jgi:dihydroorotase